uniref:Uncharacterized protein n=1 Tax=Hyaloperonospora arabidopsidis (strain Emoy2) TaxID=559515 RepID=M4B3F8_HYAAE
MVWFFFRACTPHEIFDQCVKTSNGNLRQFAMPGRIQKLGNSYGANEMGSLFNGMRLLPGQ